jgi:HAD superfamily phosphoserine phosphatase-like hydrolase
MKECIHTPPEGIQLAFFDLDETLTSRDTDLLWAHWRSRRSLKGLPDLFRLRRINRLYYNHTLTEDEYGAYQLSRARSMTPLKYAKMAADFALWVSRRHIYAPMKEIIHENQQKGIKNVLITAQDGVIGSAFQRLLGLDTCLASDYIIEEKRFKEMRKPLCFKEGKVYWAARYLKENSLSWDQCAFYTDSLNDLPLMESCACPVAVHPGPELEALCRMGT